MPDCHEGKPWDRAGEGAVGSFVEVGAVSLVGAGQEGAAKPFGAVLGGGLGAGG